MPFGPKFLDNAQFAEKCAVFYSVWYGARCLGTWRGVLFRLKGTWRGVFMLIVIVGLNRAVNLEPCISPVKDSG